MRLGKIKRIQRLFGTKKKRPLQLVLIGTEAIIALTYELMVPLSTNSLGCYWNHYTTVASMTSSYLDLWTSSIFLRGLNKS
jgi:hypothetical protein